MRWVLSGLEEVTGKDDKYYKYIVGALMENFFISYRIVQEKKKAKNSPFNFISGLALVNHYDFVKKHVRTILGNF